MCSCAYALVSMFWFKFLFSVSSRTCSCIWWYEIVDACKRSFFLYMVACAPVHGGMSLFMFVYMSMRTLFVFLCLYFSLNL